MVPILVTLLFLAVPRGSTAAVEVSSRLEYRGLIAGGHHPTLTRHPLPQADPPLSTVVTYGRDLVGRAFLESWDDGGVVTRKWDERGNQVEVTNGPVKETVTYDGVRKVLAASRASERRTFGYDKDGRQLKEKHENDAVSWQTSYEYDTAAPWRLKKTVHPDGTSEENLTFDPDDAVRTWKNRYGQTVGNTYDAGGRRKRPAANARHWKTPMSRPVTSPARHARGLGLFLTLRSVPRASPALRSQGSSSSSSRSS